MPSLKSKKTNKQKKPQINNYNLTEVGKEDQNKPKLRKRKERKQYSRNK